MILAWEKSKQAKIIKHKAAGLVPELLFEFRPNFKLVFLAGVVCIAGFVFGAYQKMPVQKELNEVIAQRPKNPNVNPNAGYEELAQLQVKYQNNIKVMDKLVRNQLYLTPQFSAIPGLISEGVWLTQFSFSSNDEQPEFSLEGMVFLGSEDSELEAINNLLLSLKNESNFSMIFREIRIASFDKQNIGDNAVTHFIITGRNK